MMAETTIAHGKRIALWAKKQAVAGTFTKPAATDYVPLINDMNPKQDRVFLNSKEKILTFGVLSRLAGPYKGGEFSLQAYIKPSGSLGVSPLPDALLEAVFGVKTIVGSTSVTYTLAPIDTDLPFVSMIYRDNDITHFITDGFVDKFSTKIAAGEGDDALVTGDFSGVFLKSVRAGTSSLTAQATSGATSLAVADAKRFEVGAYIIVGADTNTGAGYLISAVDPVANTLTIPALGSTVAISSVVTGWYPTITNSGSLVHGRFGVYQEQIGGAGGYSNVTIISAGIALSNGIKVLNDEKTDASYPASVTRGERTVEINLERYAKPPVAALRYHSNVQSQFQLKLYAGSAAASRLYISAPNVQWDTATLSGDAERKAAIKGTAFETVALNDSLQLQFA